MNNPLESFLLGMLKSWTAWFGTLLIALPDLLPLVMPELEKLLTPTAFTRTTQIIGLIVILLRVKTTTSVIEKGAPKDAGFIRPGMLLLLASLAIAPLLSGCQTLQELVGPGEAPKVDQTLSVPAQAAQQAVNEANLTITATANVIGNNAESGVMTKAEAQKALDEVADWRKKAKAAQSLLDAGDIGNAKTQAELINQAVLALQKRVAAEARKPQ